MSEIHIQNVLEKIEDYLTDQYFDEPETIEEGLDIAADFIFGINDTEGVIADEMSKIISTQDYLDYCALTCDDPMVSDYFYGDRYTSPLHYEVRDLLDEILQVTVLENVSSQISLWGECPEMIFSPHLAFNPLEPVETPKREVAIPEPTEKPEKPAPSSPTTPKPTPEPTPSWTSSTSLTISTPETRLTKPPKLSPKALCKGMEVPKQGAYLLYVGRGFSCEFNYLTPIKKRFTFFDREGKEKGLTVYDFNKRTPPKP